MREPLVWPGGTRHSASGLLVQIHTDEGIVGLGEAPGPTLPTIQTIIEQELAQFLVGQDPLRVEWLVHRMEEFTRNWSRIGAYAIAGVDRAGIVREAVRRGEAMLGADVPNTQIYVIGDTPLDISAAHAVDCTAIAVATGHFDAAALREAGADHVLETLEEELPLG